MSWRNADMRVWVLLSALFYVALAVAVWLLAPAR